MKHGRIVRETPQEDGSTHIRTEGYLDNLNSIKEEIRQNINTTPETLMADVLRCLEVVNTTETPNMTIEIIKHHNVPQRIVKTYTVYKKEI